MHFEHDEYRIELIVNFGKNNKSYPDFTGFKC